MHPARDQIPEYTISPILSLLILRSLRALFGLASNTMALALHADSSELWVGGFETPAGDHSEEMDDIRTPHQGSGQGMFFMQGQGNAKPDTVFSVDDVGEVSPGVQAVPIQLTRHSYQSMLCKGTNLGSTQNVLNRRLPTMW